MKNILNRLEFHYTYLIIAFSAVLTAFYKELIIITIIIIIHELGHYLMAKRYHYTLDKIYIYPYGGMIKYNDYLNRPIKEELMVLISGPISQIMGYLLILFFFKLNLISDNYYHLYYNYHYAILFFNLIPIHPLDGSKLVNLLLNKVFSYQRSFFLTIYLSIICLIIIIWILKLQNFNYAYFLILMLLITKTIDYFKNHKYFFNKFLLERYLHHFQFKKTKRINNIKQMMRDKKHLFKNNGKYETESYILKKLFDFK